MKINFCECKYHFISLRPRIKIYVYIFPTKTAIIPKVSRFNSIITVHAARFYIDFSATVGGIAPPMLLFHDNWNHIIGSLANVSRTNNDKIYPKLNVINRNHFPSLILRGTRFSAMNYTHHANTAAVLDGRNTDALKLNSSSCPTDAVTDGRNNLNLFTKWTVVPRYLS